MNKIRAMGATLNYDIVTTSESEAIGPVVLRLNFFLVPPGFCLFLMGTYTKTSDPNEVRFQVLAK